MIKLIVSDLDGTLFDGSHTLPKENAEAIYAAKRAGIAFMVATGRSIENIEPIFKPFHINCKMIVMNGAQFIDESSNVIKEIVMSQDDVEAVLHCMLQFGVNARVYTDHGLACSNPIRILSEFKERLKAKEHKTEEEIDKILHDSKFGHYDFEIGDVQNFMNQSYRVYKIEAFSNDESIIAQVRKELGARPSVALSNSVGDNIEVTHLQAQKGYMLEYACEYLNIKKEEVITFGDSMNDLTMMRDFPNSFAMSNAVDVIQEAAHYQTGSNEEFGVAQVIYNILKKQVKL